MSELFQSCFWLGFWLLCVRETTAFWWFMNLLLSYLDDILFLSNKLRKRKRKPFFFNLNSKCVASRLEIFKSPWILIGCSITKIANLMYISECAWAFSWEKSTVFNRLQIKTLIEGYLFFFFNTIHILVYFIWWLCQTLSFYLLICTIW